MMTDLGSSFIGLIISIPASKKYIEHGNITLKNSNFANSNNFK